MTVSAVNAQTLLKVSKIETGYLVTSLNKSGETLTTKAFHDAQHRNEIKDLLNEVINILGFKAEFVVTEKL